MIKKKVIILLFFINLINSINTFSTPNLKLSRDDAKAKIVEALRKEASNLKYKYPSNYQNLITNLASTTIIKFDNIQINRIDTLKRIHSFPDSVINQFKKIKYLNGVISYEKFEFSNYKSITKIEYVFGVVTRLNDKDIYFAYVKGDANGKEIYQYNIVPYKDCTTILFITSCSTKHKKVKRGLMTHELNTIKQALNAKFYETLNSILDLDQQRIIELFKNHAKRVVKQYPKEFEKHVVLYKSFLDFYTINLKTYSIDSLKNKGFNQESINKIKSLSRISQHVDIYQTIKDNKNEHELIIGVALKTNNNILLSYVLGRSNAKYLEGYCEQYLPTLFKNFNTLNQKDTITIDQCKDDEECIESCNVFKKKNPKFNLPGFNNGIFGNKRKKNDIFGNHKELIENMRIETIGKQLLVAVLTQNLVNILSDIKF